jgi:hypothetical protein
MGEDGGYEDDMDSLEDQEEIGLGKPNKRYLM